MSGNGKQPQSTKEGNGRQKNRNGNQGKPKGKPRPRRNRRGRRLARPVHVFSAQQQSMSKASVARAAAIANNELITPVKAISAAQGSVNAINVITTVNNTAVNGFPTGIVSRALAAGAPIPYAIYLAIWRDVNSILQGNVGTQASRLAYLNDILSSFAPKSVPYRMDAEIVYTLAGLATSDPSPAITGIGGKTWYMWENTGTVTPGGWNVQAAPGGYTPAEIASAYVNAMTLLSAGKEPHLQFLRDVTLTKKYSKDVSFYARSSRYYGEALGEGGPSLSIENEVPFKIPLLGCFFPFDPSTPRSSRYLRVTATDPCVAGAIGSLPMFPTNLYENKVPINFKFLDLDELCFLLANIALAAVTQKIVNSAPLINSEFSFLDNGFSFSYKYFRLAVRQQILYMFSESQAIGQFMTFENNGSGRFLPFLLGSNTVSKFKKDLMIVPGPVNENMKMLRLVRRPYETRDFESARNAIIDCPVWGAFLGSVSPSFVYTNSQGNPTSLFQVVDEPEQPDIWDGVLNGTPVELDSDPTSNVIIDWNMWMTALTNVLAGPEQMGGQSMGSPLLQYTRFVRFDANVQRVEIHDINRVPRMYHQYIQDIELDDDCGKETKLVRTKSQKKKIKKFYNPPNSTPFNEFTDAVSSKIKISPTMKSLVNALILPVIEIGDGNVDNVPSVESIQSFTQEPNKLQYLLSTNVFDTRASEIVGSMFHFVPGLAGKDSGWAKYVENMSKFNKGGVFGDIFSFIGNTVGAVVPGVREVAGVATGIANAFGA